MQEENGLAVFQLSICYFSTPKTPSIAQLQVHGPGTGLDKYLSSAVGSMITLSVEGAGGSLPGRGSSFHFTHCVPLSSSFGEPASFASQVPMTAVVTNGIWWPENSTSLVGFSTQQLLQWLYKDFSSVAAIPYGWFPLNT